MTEYEKVEDISVGEVVDEAYNGKQFYYGDNFNRVDFEKVDIFTLSNWLVRSKVYTRKESQWWEELKDKPVMASLNKIDWVLTVFSAYDDHIQDGFLCQCGRYDYMRPLTTAERDAIKVRD